MSIEALNWAQEQDTRKPAWQGMIYVLANASDPECVAFHWWKSKDHWWPYLQQHTGLSRSAVFRVLGELEKVGLITRSLVTPAGGGAGQPVITINRKMALAWDDVAEAFDVSIAADPKFKNYQYAHSIEWDAATESYRKTGEPQEIVGSQPSQYNETNQPLTDASPASPPEGRSESMSGTAYNTNPNTNPSEAPQRPPRGLLSEGDQAQTKESFERFRRERQPYPIEDEVRCQAIWQKLAPDDREIRIKAIAEWVTEQRRRSKTSTPLAAHRWLGEGTAERPGKWQGYWAQAQARGTPGHASAGRYDPESREGRAIMTLCRIARYDPLLASGTVAIPHPMTAQLLALADAPPFEEWRIFVQRTQPFGAWVEMTRTYLAGRALRALTKVRAPWLFPPKLDGTIYDGASIQPEGPDQAAADLAESEGYR